VDVSGVGFDELMVKYEEALVMREFEIGTLREAIIQAFGGRK
jgi:hypothetical protein